MRVSFAILALALGCAGNYNVADRAERPSFYDENNSAEYYGRCPTCHRWVKGYFTISHYGDATTGKPIGAESGVTGACQYCKAQLTAENPFPLTNNSRMVTWRAR
jgi:hypothetical protein